MFIPLILFIISKAPTGVKSFVCVNLFTQIKYLQNCMFNIEMSITLLMYIIPITLIAYISYRYAYRYAIIICIYTYYLCCFITSDSCINLSNFGFSLVIAMSVLTLIVLFMNKSEKNNYSFLNTIKYLSLMPKEYWLLTLFGAITIREFRISIVELTGGSYFECEGYMFYLFAFMVPMIIISRIVYNIMKDFWLIGIINVNVIILITVAHIINPSNYKLLDIRMSNLLLIIYVFIPLINILPDLWILSFSIDPNKELPNKSMVNRNIYFIYSFDDISYPPNLFNNEVELNVEMSLTYNELRTNGAMTVPKEISTGWDRTCRLLYQNKYWVRTNSGLYFEEPYVKSRFTQSIDNFISQPIDLGFSFNLGGNSYLLNPGIASKLQNLQSAPEEEHRVDGFVATLLPHFFGINRGYGYNPQSVLLDDERFGKGKVDFMVDFNNIPVLMVEDKAISKSADSWLDLIGQARIYAKNNPEYEVVFVMVIKGRNVAFFMYDQDWHSIHGLDMKGEDYQDLICLEVKKQGIFWLPQSNTYHPQVKIYNIGDNPPPSHVLGISTILSYISGFKKGASVENNLEVPSNQTFPRDLGRSSGTPNQGTYQLGLNFRLQVDSFGKFIHRV